VCGNPAEICLLKQPLPTDVSQCGVGCYYIPEENKCTHQCPQFYVANAITGGCDLLACSQRYPNSTLSFDYCGPKCFQADFLSCTDSCGASDYDPVTKVCELDECENIMYDPSLLRKCGDYCAFDPALSVCASSCLKYYDVHNETGVCVPNDCASRIPDEFSLSLCGPYPCYLSSSSCVANCPSGQASSSVGICGLSSLSGFVYVGIGGSLNNALNTQLDKSAATSTVHINQTTYFADNADIGGVTVEGDTGGSTVVVSPLSTLFSLYYGNKPTLLTRITFDFSLGVMASSLINATVVNSPSPSFTINNVTFNYQAALGVPLIVLSGINNVQITNSTFARKTTELLGSNFSDMCQVQTNSPALDLYNVKGTISTSTFQNINTGMCMRMYILCRCI
jgi:hypothetical protein